MNVNDIVSLVQMLGFPIVMCGFLGYVGVKLFTKVFSLFDAIINEIRNDNKELNSILCEKIDALTRAIELDREK